MSKDALPMHYRIYEQLECDGVVIRVEEFKPIKETPQGYWVVSRYAPAWLAEGELRKRKFARWVSKTSIKRKCYPSIEEAMSSFVKRKRRQASILRWQLEQAELALARFDLYKGASLAELRLSVNIGQIPSAVGMSLDY